MTTLLEITDHPDPDELALIGRELTEFNDGDVGPSGRQTLAVIVRNTSRKIVAGVSGYTAWGWLYVQWLWVAETERGNGLAAQMLTAAESEARQRGCHAAYIDTFNPTALKTYQRQGYVTFGELKDFPRGRTRSFLQKPL